ncbi:MAG: hypothetical protein PHO55_10965 [Thiomonas arsenitoxydans]|nr:hypothetical protein [Thiomonas arsenitoxydans]
MNDEPIEQKRTRPLTIIIGASDKEADWLKQLDDGAYQQEDLAAHAAVAKELSAGTEDDAGEEAEADNADV